MIRHTASRLVRSPESTTTAVDVLLVCRANRCRSPFAQALAQQIADSSVVRFASAGLLPGGEPMPSAGRAAATELGLGIEGHRSAELDLDDLDGFDLILTMARDQARDIVAENPELRARVFTLKQFVRWATDHPRRPGMDVREWVHDHASQRSASELIGSDPRDDIADPLHEPTEAWMRMAEELRVQLTTAIGAIVAGHEVRERRASAS